MDSIYTVTNTTAIAQFISEHGFGTLHFNSGSTPCTVAMPFVCTLRHNKIILNGFVNNNEIQGYSIKNGTEVLALFNGPYCYIKGSWYGTGNLSYYNYKLAKLNGTITILQGKDAANLLLEILQYYDNQVPSTDKVTNEITTLTPNQLSNYTVVTIDVTRAVAVFELCQTLNDVDFSKVIRELKKQDDYSAMLIAFEMEQQLRNRVAKKN